MLKKFKVLIVIASLAITLSLMSNTYSRYVASSEGNVALEFARWQILVNTTDITDSTSSTLEFEPVIDTNNGNVAENKVAPSSTGYFDVVIDPTNVDVSFTYSIDLAISNSLTDANGNPIQIDDLKMTEYGILPDKYIEGEALTTTQIDATTSKIENTMLYTKGGFKPFTIRIFFKWFEGTDETMNDAADTIVGFAAANQQISTIENMVEGEETVEVIESETINSNLTLSATINFEQYLG